MFRPCFFAFFGILVAVLTAGPARADELKDKAQELLTAGNELAAEGDFVGALTKFRTAYELYPSPKLLLNIGTSLRQIGKNAEAADTYEAYLADPDADDSRREELEGIVVELDGQVGKIELVVGEPGMRVSFDGQLQRDFGEKKGARKILRADPGPHTVVAQKPGRPNNVKLLDVKADETITVELTLEAEDAPSGPSARVVIGWGLVGLGGAAIVVGAVLGGVALSTKADADEKCADGGEFDGFCSAEGADLLNSSRSQGIASTVTLIAGVAVAASGLAIVLTAPDEDEVKVGLGLGHVFARVAW